MKERKLRDDDIDGRRALVRSWLNEHCRYSVDAETPDDTDPLLYFLSESHTGSSTQFASAAVLLCRMVGLPARYVVGYAAPQSLFTAARATAAAVLFCRTITPTPGQRFTFPGRAGRRWRSPPV